VVLEHFVARRIVEPIWQEGAIGWNLDEGFTIR
jgi:hypothetical protein